MRLWIGIHLPLLPLETCRPCWSEPGLYAVIERDAVQITSDAAAQNGVRVGMRRTGLTAIATNLQLLERDSSKEQDAINSVALTLLQYTPKVALAEDDSILLDVTATLSATGGRLTLCRHIKQTLAVLGFTAQISCAPTARGAWLLARAPRSSRLRRTIKMASMIKRLDALSCVLLPAARPHQEWLQDIACQWIGEVRQLPRAGLQRQTNPSMLKELDQAYGGVFELLEWITPPATFSARLDLPDRIDDAKALLFSARRLIAQLAGWLVSLQKSVSHIIFWLEHEPGRYAIPATPIEIRLTEPTWEEEHLTRLMTEQLDKTELITSVIGMRLETLLLSPMTPPAGSLSSEPDNSPPGADRLHKLLELLKAHPGDADVRSPDVVADQRPVSSNPPGPAALDGVHGLAVMSAAQGQKIIRPSFLLAQPIPLILRDNQPFYGAPLQLTQGPERVETGGRNGEVIVRDYFVAQGKEAACYWVYRECIQQEVRWFLHGLFT